MASGSGGTKEDVGRRATRSGQKALEQENRKREILIRNNEISEAFLQPQKVIGPRDIILDSASGKVKIEVGDELEPVEKKPRMDVSSEGIQNEAVSQSKSEVEGLESGSGLEELPAVVKEEVDLEWDTEGPEGLDAVGTDAEELEDRMVLEETSAAALLETPGFIRKDNLGGIEPDENNEHDGGTGNANLLEENLQLKRMLKENESKLREQSAKIKHLQKSLEEMTLQQKESSTSDSKEEKATSFNLQCIKPIFFELEPIPEPEGARRNPEMEKVLETLRKLTTLVTEKQPTEPSSSAFNIQGMEKGSIFETGSSGDQQRMDTEEQVEVNEKIMELFPHVIELFWYKRHELKMTPADFRQTRLVCTNWKKAVDTIDKGPLHDCRQHMIMRLFYGSKSVRETRIKSVWKFRISSRDGPGTTTLSVSDLGSYCSREERVKCNEKLGRAIEAERENIKYLNIMRLPNETNFGGPLDWYLSLIEWVRQLPNLESIGITKLPLMGNVKEPDISEDIAKHPFPKLPKMEGFAAENWPPGVARAVLMANDQITSMGAFWADYKLDFEGISLSKLKQLSLSSMQDSTCFETLPLLEAPALQKLVLVTSLGDSFFVPEKDVFPHVMAAVVKFRNSLEDLSISVPGPDKFNGFPEMVRLQKLSLSLLESGSNCWPADKLLQLLTTLPVLEHLDLSTEYGCNCSGNPCEYADKKKVERVKHIRNDLVSKLWTTFPNMKKVEVHIRPKTFMFIRASSKTPI